MNTIDDFVNIIRDELGLALSTEDVGRSFDEVPGWDSLHLLSLLTVLERTTGRQISMPDVLEASSLEHIYSLAVGA